MSRVAQMPDGSAADCLFSARTFHGLALSFSPPPPTCSRTSMTPTSAVTAARRARRARGVAPLTFLQQGDAPEGEAEREGRRGEGRHR